MDNREEFLSGVLAMIDAMRSAGIDPEAMTIVLSERDGRTLEHILTKQQELVVSGAFDPRYSSPKADKHIREFKICGVRFQYKTKPFILPSGDII